MVRPCPTYAGATRCGIEWATWMQIEAFVEPRHTVIEFGARYGTSSCRLAMATNNTGNVVSVEPDASVAPHLLLSRDANRCNFHVVFGSLGRTQLAAPTARKNHGGETGCGYACRFSASSRAGVAAGVVPHLTIAEIEERIGSQINAALIDCEGCIEDALTPRLLAQLELVMIEEDGRSQYQLIDRRLLRHGFARVWYAKDDMGIPYSTYVRGAAPSNLCTQFLATSGWAQVAATTRAGSSKSALTCM